LLLPVLTAWSPVRLGILPATPASRSAVFESPDGVMAERTSPVEQPTIQQPVPNAATITPAEEALASPRNLISIWRTVAMIWLAVAVIVAGWLAAGFFSVRRIVRRARPLDDRTWTIPLYEIADRLEIDATPRLLRSDDVKMPFACGLLTPTIILPAESEGWDLERRRAVLMHELAHIRRRDLVGHTLGRLACAVYWFHPLVWTAVRRLRIESERACDDLALVCGLRPSNYAEHLLDIVSGLGRTRTPAIAIPMAHRREFEGRMLAILDPEVRRRAGRRQSAGILVALASLVFVVSAAVPAERTSRPNSPVASPALSADSPVAKDVALGSGGNPRIQSERQTTQTLRQDTRQEQRAEETQAVQSSAQGAQPLQIERERDHDVDLEQLASDTTDERAALLMTVLRSDTSARLRRIAAWGLANHAERSDVGAALATALRRDGSATVREMSAWALAHGSERRDVIDALVEALRRDSDENVREAAAWTLGNLDAEAAADALSDALSGQSKRLRMLALWSLGNAAPKTAPRAVIGALSDAEPQVRRLAAWVLYQIEDPETVGALEQALNKEQDSDLRLAYIRALGAIGERSSTALARLLDSRDPEVRAVVVSALAGRGGGPWPWPWPWPRPSP
ncbi:MAG: M56 family metallopeptidase, partial [Gemmatimonadota bacterium]